MFLFQENVRRKERQTDSYFSRHYKAIAGDQMTYISF